MSKFHLIIGAAFVCFVLAVTATAQQSNVGGMSARPRFQDVTIVKAGTPADQTLKLQSTRPMIQLRQTDAAANNGNWSLQAIAEAFICSAYDDAGTAVTNWCRVERTGSTVDSIGFTATALTLNNNEIVRSSAGTYSPTVTNVSNVSGCAPGTTTSYLRVGNTVTVSGVVDGCSAGASGNIGIAVSLPVASNFTVLSDAAGAAVSVGSTAIARGVAAAILSDAVNDRVDLLATATASGLFTLSYTFTYTVK